MHKKIIKTSVQAKAEKRKTNQDATCPECGWSLNFSTYHYERGCFKRQVKVNTYTCSNCGCQWEIRSM